MKKKTENKTDALGPCLHGLRIGLVTFIYAYIPSLESMLLSITQRTGGYFVGLYLNCMRLINLTKMFYQYGFVRRVLMLWTDFLLIYN